MLGADGIGDVEDILELEGIHDKRPKTIPDDVERNVVENCATENITATNVCRFFLFKIVVHHGNNIPF